MARRPGSISAQLAIVDQQRDNRDLASSGPVRILGTLVVLGGLALSGVRFAGGSPPEQGLEGALGSLALGAIVAAPGVMALLAARGRPALLLPAGIVLIPLSFLSFALVTLPLLIPAVLFLDAYGRRSARAPKPRGTRAGTALVVMILLVAAVVVLLAHQDPRSYTTATGGGSVSDVITYLEAMGALALSAAAVAVGWLLAAPGEDDREATS